MEKKNIFVTFLEKFVSLPLWIKEVLYIHLKEDMEKYAIGTSQLDKSDLYQYYLPTLTYIGKKELSSRDNDHEPKVYKFLEGAAQGLNALEITLNNYWTLEETAILNMLCIEKEYVSSPSTVYANAMALYFSGKIRIGEYFKRIGQVNVDQLDMAIRKQKELEAAGQKAGMASVMINLGLVSEEDTKNILYMKDESKKRFIFNTDLLGKSATPVTQADNIMNMTSQSQGANNAIVEKLVRENNLLKNKIKAIIQVIQGQ